MIPILNPAGLQELYRLFGSMAGRCRASPARWVGVKCVHDTVESTGVIEAGLDRIRPKVPNDLQDAAGRAQHPAE